MSFDERIEFLWSTIVERGLVDTHFHIGPEFVPRKYDVFTLARAAREVGATMVLKCHTWPTTPLASLARLEFDAAFVGSVVLNHGVGGLNPHAVRAAVTGNHTDLHRAEAADPPMVVWMPTVHAAAHMRFHGGGTFDARWLGCGGGEFESLSTEEVAPIEAFDPRGRPLPELIDVVDAIVETGSTLATGHLGPEETMDLVEIAIERGVERIVVTHPHYPCTDLSDEQLVHLSSRPGVWLEHCMAIHTLENVPIERFATSIKATGPDRVLLASDFGQVHSESFPDGNRTMLAKLVPLIEDEIDDDDIVAMFSDNCRRALGLPKPIANATTQ
ncbi:MAG: DUF6282 family protein [Planctomycetota bacterium]|nr:DUF6282 family protein [Planctomycetota bacterium]